MKKISLLFILCILFTTSCAKKNDLEPTIKFKTTDGTIVVKLYSETPKHRDNFVKLVESGFYNGTLFHRVIKDFMIQAGDPDSKNAKRMDMLGSGDVGYTIDAEIVCPKYYHKKGVLAAARQGNDVNPQRASSGCQFYIVKGHIFTDKELNELELKRKTKLEEKLLENALKSNKLKFNKLNELNNQTGSKLLRDSLLKSVQLEINSNPTYKYSEQQRSDYKTIGGTPHLDNEYTVFGEVIKGIEIVSNISMVKTNKMDRPLENVRIISAKRIR